MKSVGVFTNVSTQYTAVSQLFCRAKIDYAKYLAKAVGDDNLFRAIAYGVQMNNEAASFITYLRHNGFITRYKIAKRTQDGQISIKDTDWNFGIAMDIVRVIERLDIVILGSNDPTLIPLIDFIRERGVKAVIFSCSVPAELAKAADQVIRIDRSMLEEPKDILNETSGPTKPLELSSNIRRHGS